MNTTTIAGIVAAVVVIGGGAYLYMNSGSPTDQVASVLESQNENASVGRTFSELIASGQLVECTFSYDDGAGNASNGTIYLAGKDRFRGNFSVTSPTAMEMSIVRTGGYNYMWGSSFPQGMKVAVTAENEGQVFDSSTGAIDPNTQYKCVSWAVDESKFELPSTVQFMDVGAMMGS